MHSHISLFNDERYQRCNLRPGQRLFRYDHSAGGRLVGTLSGVVDGEVLECGHSAPFGGIDWARRRELVGIVVELLRAASARARSNGIREMRIRARPPYYGANETACEFALFNRSASVECCEMSLGVETGRYRTSADYVASLGCSARNTLHHGLRAGMAFSQAATATEWAICYDLLAETKRRRGAEMKYSLDYLLNLREIFGPRIAMHRLTRGGGLAGAALVYRIARHWDCVAAWGDDLDHPNNKVMNVMTYHLVCEAIAGRVAILDLGGSSIDGVPDDRLIQFKRSVGATTGSRLCFRLPLD
jgi:hypothetical protein